MNNSLPRHAEFEERLLQDFGVTDIRVYYAFSVGGDAWIAVRGDSVYFAESGCLYGGSIEEALYKAMARRLGLLPPLGKE